MLEINIRPYFYIKTGQVILKITSPNGITDIVFSSWAGFKKFLDSLIKFYEEEGKGYLEVPDVYKEAFGNEAGNDTNGRG